MLYTSARDRELFVHFGPPKTELWLFCHALSFGVINRLSLLRFLEHAPLGLTMYSSCLALKNWSMAYLSVSMSTVIPSPSNSLRSFKLTFSLFYSFLFNGFYSH